MDVQDLAVFLLIHTFIYSLIRYEFDTFYVQDVVVDVGRSSRKGDKRRFLIIHYQIELPPLSNKLPFLPFRQPVIQLGTL